MGRLIVVQFITLDGVVEDPDGSDGTPFGGWAMRYGPQGVAGDKFRLGSHLRHRDAAVRPPHLGALQHAVAHAATTRSPSR